MNKIRCLQKGYIALSTVLITLALVILIGLSTSLLSINDLLSSQSGRKSNGTVDLTEACVEDVLIKLNKTNLLISAVTLPEGSCSVILNSQVGITWDFTVSASLDGFTKNVRVNATRGSNVTVNSWLDV